MTTVDETAWYDSPQPFDEAVGANEPLPQLVDAMPRRPLEFQTLAELCAEVDAAGPRQWLVRGVWPAGAYGVHGAEMKAQKTWNALDFAVSVATGTPWLGAIPVDASGPVVVFAGEGGKASIVRRLRAITRSRGIEAADVPIVVCARAPHLSNGEHLAIVAEQLAATRPLLVVLDPLYLAAGGAKSSDLYAMGALLEPVQHLCENAGSALLVVTHYNRKEGSGPLRLTGAGPAEWGRVLIGATILARHTDTVTLETTVIAELGVIGGEVADQAIKIKRRIRALDPDDLDSALDYHVEILAADTSPDQRQSDLSPAAQKVLEALTAATEPETIIQITQRIVDTHGHGLKRETVSRELSKLAKLDTVERTNPEAPVSEPGTWQIRRVTGVTSHVTSQHRVTGVISPIQEITRHDHTSDDVDDAEVQRLLDTYGDGA